MSEATEPCPWCGALAAVVHVHGHGQCGHCGGNLEPCCSGSGDSDAATPVDTIDSGVDQAMFSRLFGHLGGAAATVTADSLCFALVQHLGTDLDDARLVIEAAERVGVLVPVAPGCYRLRGPAGSA
ncbi:MAG: hypothetical protein K8J09_18460 [Planctomycetes bacterium]|nr:hypothetical protein [Planctomycetota bacterium]MCC7396972.1 hypothetical protein [Planctomycetota bacterium]